MADAVEIIDDDDVNIDFDVFYYLSNVQRSVFLLVMVVIFTYVVARPILSQRCWMHDRNINKEKKVLFLIQACERSRKIGVQALKELKSFSPFRSLSFTANSVTGAQGVYR